jgi:hypothetical protein
MHATGRTALFVATLLLAGSALAGTAERPRPSPATSRYQWALRDARARPHVDVEALFRLATDAGRELQAMMARADERGESPAVTRVNGLVISTEEALYALPDPRFFAELARKKGRPVDRAFFDLLIATRPDGVWPVYIEQQTDVTGCTRLDLPALPSLYERWLEFRRRPLAAYRAAAADELADMERFVLSDCACGSREAALAGLEAFVKALPGAPITAKVMARLEDLRAGRAELRAECHSG